MKTLIKPLFLALSLSFVAVSVSHAKPGRPVAASFKTGIYSSMTGKVHVALDKETGGPVEIRLTGAKGEVLYSQHLGKKETTFRACLNLDALPDGAYVLNITNGTETTRQTITLKTKQPLLLDRVIRTDVAMADN